MGKATAFNWDRHLQMKTFDISPPNDVGSNLEEYLGTYKIFGEETWLLIANGTSLYLNVRGEYFDLIKNSYRAHYLRILNAEFFVLRCGLKLIKLKRNDCSREFEIQLMDPTFDGLDELETYFFKWLSLQINDDVEKRRQSAREWPIHLRESMNRAAEPSD